MECFVKNLLIKCGGPYWFIVYFFKKKTRNYISKINKRVLVIFSGIDGMNIICARLQCECWTI